MKRFVGAIMLSLVLVGGGLALAQGRGGNNPCVVPILGTFANPGQMFQAVRAFTESNPAEAAELGDLTVAEAIALYCP